MFLTDYADMCYIYTHLSRVLRRLDMLPVSRFQNLLCPGSDEEVAQIRAEDGTFQKCMINKLLSLQKLKYIHL